ncbi:hypothetical protein B0H21DRAFT_741637 [Amylocystis lapponica]|nr:hypothetical protein B0H21DRAFT_741637 [Amylocystis lapponica]
MSQSGSGGSPRLQTQLGRGNPRALVFGVATVTAGLAAFWYGQRWYQSSKENSNSPGYIPTWEYRLGREQLPASDPSQPLPQRKSGTEPAQKPSDVPLPRSDTDQRPSGAAAAATAVSGKGSDETQRQKEQKGQAQPTEQRKGDQGETYTKNSEYAQGNDPQKKDQKQRGQ